MLFYLTRHVGDAQLRWILERRMNLLVFMLWTSQAMLPESSYRHEC